MCLLPPEGSVVFNKQMTTVACGIKRITEYKQCVILQLLKSCLLEHAGKALNLNSAGICFCDLIVSLFA
jgi:hypothetical protein